MKIVVRIILLIVLFASLSPCEDNISYKSTTATLLSASSDHPDHPLDDSCSPFCACACCHTPSFIKQAIANPHISLVVTKKYSDMFSGNVASVSLAIWQPPQLA